MSIDLKTRVYDYYAAISAGNLDDFAALLDEDINFSTNAPLEVFPHLGRRRGRAEVVKVVQQLHNEYEAVAFQPLSLVVEGDKANSLALIQAIQRQTGVHVQFYAAHFFRYRDGLIVEYRSVIDTFEVVKQVLGSAFDD